MKVVNIPSMKMMKKFFAQIGAALAVCRDDRQVPIHSIVLKHSRRHLRAR
jgi:hypothetical protein